MEAIITRNTNGSYEVKYHNSTYHEVSTYEGALSLKKHLENLDPFILEQRDLKLIKEMEEFKEIQKYNL